MVCCSFVVPIFIVGDISFLVSFCRKENRGQGYCLLLLDTMESLKEPRELWFIIVGRAVLLGSAVSEVLLSKAPSALCFRRSCPGYVFGCLEDRDDFSL